LLLGCYATAAQARSGRHLRYCGKVGTGFDERERSRLHAVLQRQARRSPPCEGDLPREDGIAWCEPRLVVQIRFTEWTHDGALRHPSYAGERLDKTPSQVVHGEAAATTSATLSRG
jgi:ATP-dependent DNA ligase